ncbi:MAG: hypothetical protein JSU04_03925 [Bdellovibrionales bacterium]|nr:hypothetical protein [Bdellovibrionales bacterium]
MLLLFWPKAEKDLKTPPDVIEFELKPSASSDGPAETPLGSQKSGGSRATSKKPTSRELVHKILSNDYSPDGPLASGKGSRHHREGSWEEGGYSKEDDPNVAWGAGGGTFERIQDFSLMKRFHAKVDALLFYPGVLARHQISGFVNARIVLNQKGDCDWRLTKIRAADPYLRVYILHLLKKVCDENYKNYLGGRVMTNVDMTFQFSISEQPTTDELIQQNQKILGNVLFFFRNSHQSVAEWHLGPLTGVFPLPFVNVDFAWVFENFDKYVNHKDPLQEFH